MPQPEVLKAIRSEIYNNIDEFREIIDHPSFVKHFGAIEGPRISTTPKGFPKDFKDIGLLQFKYYSVMKGETDTAIVKPGYIDEVREVFRAMLPFNRFLNEAIKEM